LIDFGLSDSDDYAILKQPAGTQDYVSPEQEKQYLTDVRNDVYSLGQVLSDLRLGLLSRPVVNRCMASADKRYANVKAVRRDLHAWRQWPRRLAVALMAALLIVLAAALYRSSRSDIADTAAATDSLTAIVAVDQRSNRESQSLLKQKNDSLKSRILELEAKEQTAKDHEQLLAQLTEKGKKGVDRLAASSGLAAFYDTLTTLHYSPEVALYINDARTKFVSYPEKYAKGLPESVTSLERTAIMNELISYTAEKYHARWNAKMQKIGQQYR